MSNESKEEKTIYLKNAQNGKDFVGVKITQEQCEIIFPMGYKLDVDRLFTSKISKDQRKKILNLINSIYLCTSNNKGEKISTLNGNLKSDFPIRAMFFIIEDFLDRNNYFTEKETIYTKSTSGKINWNRTIKNVKPIVSETGIAFLNFVIRKNRIQENQLITELHKYCVYKSFEIFGFLYSSIIPEKGIIDENDIEKNKKFYKQFLQDKIDSTHLESNIELFNNMLDIINNFDSEDDTMEASYGTCSYQVVWEKMIDSVFSTITQYEKEHYFYPASRWDFSDGTKKTNHPLRTDTILKENKKCFILDAKYYSYTMLRELQLENEDEQDSVLIHGSIPGTDSIQKQITYAQYIDEEIDNFEAAKRKNYRFNQKNIYNSFILPADNNDEFIKHLGFGHSDWFDGKKNYHHIHLITIDTKWLLENYKNNNKEKQKSLINFIEQHEFVTNTEQ